MQRLIDRMPESGHMVPSEFAEMVRAEVARKLADNEDPEIFARRANAVMDVDEPNST